MTEMIIKMSLITAGMCLLNVVIWALTRKRKLNIPIKLGIGVIFGVAAILSTHFGVSYENMVTNVRDIAPLSAGLFFGPLAGIVAGLIGGIERYIAGTFWGVGAYTTIACSLATIFAGFLSAFFYRCIFKWKKPSPVYALFLGGITEVFHMFAVFLTHKDDINNAFLVVDTCAVPMILFTAVGMGLSSLLLSALSGEYRNLHRPKGSEVPITTKFQVWLFVCIIVMTASTFFFSYNIQTQQALQSVQAEMEKSVTDIGSDLEYMQRNQENSVSLTKSQSLIVARALAREIENTGGIAAMTSETLEELRALYDIYEINAISSDGYITASTNPDFIQFDMRSGEQSAAFLALLDGTETELVQDYMPITADSDISVMYTGVAVSDGAIQVGFDDNDIKEFSDLTNFDIILDNQHIGESGILLVADTDGVILAGDLKDHNLSEFDCFQEDGVFFDATVFDSDSYCLSMVTDSNRIVAVMPYDEVYRSRNISAYETAFADILLFALVFMLIYILVQKIVVNNLDMINNSLNKITTGNLNEVVSVHSSAEFASLSNDINATVDTLKRYISEAENRMAEELVFARNIQTSVLPHNFHFTNREEFNLYASMDPAKQVGGDFYDFFFVDQNKLALVIADVSGKGIPAALFMMRSKTTIKGLAESGFSPAEIMTKANERLCEGNNEQMFVTAWIGIIDLETGVMTCSNAGHEYPAIRKDDGYTLYKDRHGFVLGGMDGIKYKEYEIPLKEGDRIFVYTDGVPEANDEAGNQFGTERMLAALNEEREISVTDTLMQVKQRIFEFCGEADQFDDITMLCFEFNKRVKKGNEL